MESSTDLKSIHSHLITNNLHLITKTTLSCGNIIRRRPKLERYYQFQRIVISRLFYWRLRKLLNTVDSKYQHAIINENARVSRIHAVLEARVKVGRAAYHSRILTDSSNFSMQEERRDGEPGRTPTARPQETAAGFHRPSAPYSTGYF